LLRSFVSCDDGEAYSEVVYVVPLKEEFGIGEANQLAISDLSDIIRTDSIKYRIDLYNPGGYKLPSVLPTTRGEIHPPALAN